MENELKIVLIAAAALNFTFTQNIMRPRIPFFPIGQFANINPQRDRDREIDQSVLSCCVLVVDSVTVYKG